MKAHFLEDSRCRGSDVVLAAQQKTHTGVCTGVFNRKCIRASVSFDLFGKLSLPATGSSQRKGHRFLSLNTSVYTHTNFELYGAQDVALCRRAETPSTVTQCTKHTPQFAGRNSRTPPAPASARAWTETGGCACQCASELVLPFAHIQRAYRHCTGGSDRGCTASHSATCAPWHGRWAYERCEGAQKLRTLVTLPSWSASRESNASMKFSSGTFRCPFLTKLLQQSSQQT